MHSTLLHYSPESSREKRGDTAGFKPQTLLSETTSYSDWLSDSQVRWHTPAIPESEASMGDMEARFQRKAGEGGNGVSEAVL